MLLTFSLSLMDPFPKTDILVPVCACSRFRVLPLGPSNLPTKLNYEVKRDFKNSSKSGIIFRTTVKIKLSEQLLPKKVCSKHAKNIMDVKSLWINLKCGNSRFQCYRQDF